MKSTIKIFSIFCILWLLGSTGKLFAQDTTTVNYTSKVTDENNHPVNLAAVTNSRTNVTTFTGKSGSFTIAARVTDSLLVAANGYHSAETVMELSQAGIVLKKKQDVEAINIAFGKVDKRDLPGGISVVNPDDFRDYSYDINSDAALTARVPGLLSNNNIWGMSNALIMVDGVPRSFADVTLNEVQQITVLKGANAVALYGSEGAKGVVLVTTKRGEIGDQKVTIRANTGVATPIEYPKFLNAAQYMSLYNEARENDGLTDLYDQTTIDAYKSKINPYKYPDVDYYSKDYLKSFQSSDNVNATITGGTEAARFFASVGYNWNNTLLNIGEGSKEGNNRLNVRGNVDLQLNKYISGTVDVAAVFNNSTVGHGNYWMNAEVIPPNKYTPFVPMGLIAPGDSSTMALAQSARNIINGKFILGGNQQYLTNPFADLIASGYDQLVSRDFQFTNTINFDLRNVLDGLSFKTRFNVDYNNSYTQSINNTYSVYEPVWDPSSDVQYIDGLNQYGNDAHPGTQVVSNTTQTSDLGFSGQFDYNRTFNKVHNVSATMLAYANAIRITGMYQTNYNTNLGFKVNYNYNHKYYIDFSSAAPNSTKLPQGNRIGFSPTLSLGWSLGEENFLKNSKSVDELKLFASAGIIKTDLDFSDYYLYDNIYNSQAYFGWDDGIYTNQATTALRGGNPNLIFEERKDYNITLDGSFFKHLLEFNATYFLTRIEGQPTQAFTQYPNYYANFVPYSNYNADQFSGIDFSAQLNKDLGKVKLNFGVTGTYVTSKAFKRDEFYVDAYQDRAGKPVDAIFGLKNQGFFQDQSDINSHPTQAFGTVLPGDIKYKDQNADNIVDSRDQVMIGRWGSPFNIGVNLAITYQNFTLFVQGTGSFGGDGVKSNDYYWVEGDKKYSDVVLGRWTEATKATATFPRLSAQTNNNDFQYSDFWMYSTDRFDLSKVQLTYTIPSRVLKHMFINQLSAFVNGSNLYTFSKNKDILHLNWETAPQMRYFNLGLKLQF